jgi:hypothetical protein
VPKGLQVLLVLKEPLEVRVQQVPPVRKVQQVYKEALVHREVLELPELKVPLVVKDLLD